MMSTEEIVVGGYYKVKDYVFHVLSEGKGDHVTCRLYDKSGQAYQEAGTYFRSYIAYWAEKRVMPRKVEGQMNPLNA